MSFWHIFRRNKNVPVVSWPLAVSESKALYPRPWILSPPVLPRRINVSMGGWAARKALRVIEHVEQGNPGQLECRPHW